MTQSNPVPARLEVCTRPLTALQLDPKNPRTHGKRQIRQIAKSIQTFGFNVPILVDANLKVIAGHGRVLACRELGWTEVPTLSLDHLSPAQAQAFLIADNRLAENARWDEQLLAENLKELSLLDLDFSLDVIGFDMGEIDLRIESLDNPAEPDKADTLPPPGQAVTQSGDLWLLGAHRILCADSREAASYETVMAGHLAAVVFEDPPYNVPIAGHVSTQRVGGIPHREFAMATGEMSPTEFTDFLRRVFGLAVQFSKPGSIHFQCMDWRHVAEITAAGQGVYELKNICVWVKNVGGMGSLYRSRHELVFVFKNGHAPHVNNVELGRHGRYRTNVWNYPSIASSRKATDEGDLLALHPTVKPVRLVADALLDVSNRGDIVLDGFLGSGSTLIAAQRVGRICHGIEIDPLYVDTAIRRWQADTGGDAIHAATGQTFTQREQAARAAATATDPATDPATVASNPEAAHV